VKHMPRPRGRAGRIRIQARGHLADCPALPRGLGMCFTALIFRRPEVAERLDAVKRFRNAKACLPSALAAQAMCVRGQRP